MTTENRTASFNLRDYGRLGRDKNLICFRRRLNFCNFQVPTNLKYSLFSSTPAHFSSRFDIALIKFRNKFPKKRIPVTTFARTFSPAVPISSNKSSSRNETRRTYLFIIRRSNDEATLAYVARGRKFRIEFRQRGRPSSIQRPLALFIRG